eukprot:scaffold123592_cov66-Phaeocystis_antarctica.AAC.1
MQLDELHKNVQQPVDLAQNWSVQMYPTRALSTRREEPRENNHLELDHAVLGRWLGLTPEQRQYSLPEGHYVESPMWSNAVPVRHRWTTRDPGGIYTGARLDIPEKSPACYGVLPPFKTIEIHPCLRPLREDRGRPRELDVRSKSGIAPSSSGGTSGVAHAAPTEDSLLAPPLTDTLNV